MAEQKRKTHTSSEVKARYNNKTYVQYGVKFRKADDADVIDYVESEKRKGKNTSDIFKEAIRRIIKKEWEYAWHTLPYAV